jgi:hypothetical protein
MKTGNENALTRMIFGYRHQAGTPETPARREIENEA